MYLAKKYGDFSVIFYNSQCNDMIAVTSVNYFTVWESFFKTDSHIIAYHIDVSGCQKEYKTDRMKDATILS